MTDAEIQAEIESAEWDIECILQKVCEKTGCRIFDLSADADPITVYLRLVTPADREATEKGE